MPTRVDKQTGNCRECQGGLTCMHCHPESAPMDVHRIAELEAQIAEIHASAKRMTFANEWYVEGVRHRPGVYVLMRVGPVPDDHEPTF